MWFFNITTQSLSYEKMRGLHIRQLPDRLFKDYKKWESKPGNGVLLQTVTLPTPKGGGF